MKQPMNRLHLRSSDTHGDHEPSFEDEDEGRDRWGSLKESFQVGRTDAHGDQEPGGARARARILPSAFCLPPFRFVGSTAALMIGILAMAAIPVESWAQPGPELAALKFLPDGKGFRFDTGALKGRLRAEGRSQGLSEVSAAGAKEIISSSMGLFSHYRLLDDQARYGTAAWDWASEANLRADGAVEVRWQADRSHPFDMKAVYRWSAPDTLDLVTSVTAGKEMRGFEVFLASYFKGFERSLVRARYGARETFLEAKEADATWHMFPRDDSVLGLIKDGRWQREPHPVAWTIRPPLAGRLAMRTDTATGLTGVVMAAASDCFAVATPFGAEGHRSIYLSLLGKDLAQGETATARCRLVIRRNLGEEQAVARYQEFLQHLSREVTAEPERDVRDNQ